MCSSPARRSMRKQVDTGCSRSNPGKPSKHAWRSHGAAVARSHVIPQAEMPAIDPWWACRQGPCAAPRAIARSRLSGKLTRAAGGWKGTRAGLATRPGLRDDSPWRTWQIDCGWSLLNHGVADTKRLNRGNLNPIYERELTKLELHQGEGRWIVSKNGAHHHQLL